MKTFVLLFQCRDIEGIVAKITDCIFKLGGNIVNADQYSTNLHAGDFFMRVEFVVENASVNKEEVEARLNEIAREFQGEAEIFDKDKILSMPIFVSKADHCLFHLLYLWKAGDLKVKIPFVASNFEGHRQLVEQFQIPFHYIPASQKDMKEAEFLALLKDADFLVLARYMLILSKHFLDSFPKDIINIHHGFLPSFKGGNPYKQALDKGVKVIGATAHFVSDELDDGPIITQEVEYVSHKDGLDSLVRKGKHLENRALSDAILSYVDYRIIRHKNKTIVF